MSDYHGEPTRPKARKEHRCIYCGGPILASEQYVHQTGFYEGEPYRSRYHNECWTDCAEEATHYGAWDFTPHSADYPPRVQAIIDARRAATPGAEGA